jgi:hypothetical protein
MAGRLPYFAQSYWAEQKQKSLIPWLFQRKSRDDGFLSLFGTQFELGLGRAHVAQLAERVLGKDEVTSSILVMGSIKKNEVVKKTNNIRR